MYLNLSSDIVIKKENIIGMFDLDKTTISKHTRNFIYKQKNVITVGKDLPVSYIVYLDKKDIIIYLVPISTKSLLKKSEKGVINDE